MYLYNICRFIHADFVHFMYIGFIRFYIFEHPFRKFLGECSQLEREMIKCLRKERFARQKANAVAAEKKKLEIQERMRTLRKEQKENQ